MEEKRNIPKWLVVFPLLTTFLTWLLIMLGGVVHVTESSLACPDWPTCHGTFFPEMVGGVLIEHTHRLLAASVGLLTILMVIFFWKRNRELRNLSLFGLGLVVFQGILGGVTVLLRLPPAVSIGHLGTSMAFLALLVWISAKSIKLRSSENRDRSSSTEVSSSLRPWVLIALIVTYLQIVLGAVVRHLGAGLACVDIPLCQGSLWPAGASGLLKLHMAHRIGAILVACVVLASSGRVLFSKTRNSRIKFLAFTALILVFLQIGFGLLSVALALELLPVTIHLGLGALLWVNLVLLFFSLNPSKKIKVTQPVEGNIEASSNLEGAAAS